MTLYVGKDEAGFYVSKALVHTGVALVVRRFSEGLERGDRAGEKSPPTTPDSPPSSIASWTDPGPHGWPYHR